MASLWPPCHPVWPHLENLLAELGLILVNLKGNADPSSTSCWVWAAEAVGFSLLSALVKLGQNVVSLRESQWWTELGPHGQVS